MSSRLRALLVSACLVSQASVAHAFSNGFSDVIPRGGGVGMGLAVRAEQSPYRGEGARVDILPVYLYEGERMFLHATRFGAKLDSPGSRLEIFLQHRFEGYPTDRVPVSLSGMRQRDAGVDLGAGYELRHPWGNVYGEVLHDISSASKGTELRVGYTYDMQLGGFKLRPYAMVASRDHKLNDYYYGVAPGEVTATRPEYAPGAGLNGQVGLSARYDLSRRWHVLGGASLTRWSSGVRKSPIVGLPVAQASGFLGIAYDFTPEAQDWKDHAPVIAKAMYGRSTDCNLVPVMRLTCRSIDTTDRTSITGVMLGRPLVQGANGWPLDFVGYVGAIYHNERNLQPDEWEVIGQIKAFYYGFPWRERVKTRIGFGTGISYAHRVPFVEQRDQLRRGRPTSKLLNYLDPSIDLSVGDVLSRRSLKDMYFGFGASHRSGIFGRSQFVGNVNGGSNYIYTYLEWRL